MKINKIYELMIVMALIATVSFAQNSRIVETTQNNFPPHLAGYNPPAGETQYDVALETARMMASQASPIGGNPDQIGLNAILIWVMTFIIYFFVQKKGWHLNQTKIPLTNTNLGDAIGPTISIISSIIVTIIGVKMGVVHTDIAYTIKMGLEAWLVAIGLHHGFFGNIVAGMIERKAGIYQASPPNPPSTP